MTRYKSLGIHVRLLLERHSSGCLSNWVYNPSCSPHTSCALSLAAPSESGITAVFPWILSPAVLSYFGNLFIFESFFILARALPNCPWVQQLCKDRHCLHVSFRHPLASLGSPLLWNGAPGLPGYLQPVMPGPVVTPGGQPGPGLAVPLEQSALCASVPRMLNPVWSLPLPA